MQASGLASNVPCNIFITLTSLSSHAALMIFAAGVDHENLLNQMLADANIAFWTEEHLRAKGFFKTPDAMLQVCICTWTQT